MLLPPSSRRLVCSAVLLVSAVTVLPGCRFSMRNHGSGSTISPHPISEPESDQYDESGLGSPTHSIPDLSPVPPLPGAGHSGLNDEGIPPAPASDGVSPTGLKSESESSSAETSQSPVAESPPRWKRMLKVPAFASRSVAEPLPSLKPGRHASAIGQRGAEGPATSHVASVKPQSALMHSAQFALRPSSTVIKPFDSDHPNGQASFQSAATNIASIPVSNDPTTLPVLTPMIAPIRTRTITVDQWPHQAKQSASPSATEVTANSAPALASPVEQLSLPEPLPSANDVNSPALLPPGL
jgi:hypothetical protein